MSFLKKLFKPKPGGTFVGNLLRTTTKLASGLVPGANIVSKLLPDAPPSIVQQAEQAIATAAAAPAAEVGVAKDVASEIKSQLVALGVAPALASNVGAVAFTAAQAPPQQADDVLRVASGQMDLTNNLTGKDMKTILNGALDGIKTGATDAYLDGTEDGKQVKKDAINSQGQKFMPWLLGIAIGAIVLLLAKRN